MYKRASNLQILILCFFILTPAKAVDADCGRWAKQIAHWLSTPLSPVLHTKVSRSKLGEEAFFTKRGKPKLHAFEDYMKTYEEGVLEVSPSIIISRVYLYASTTQTQLKPTVYVKAMETYGVENPSFRQVRDFFIKEKNRMQADLSEIDSRQLRTPFRVLLRYKYLILATTVFVLWEPIQAEIRSGVYWGFNTVRSVITGNDPGSAHIDTETRQIHDDIKRALREMFFVSSDEYPSTMMMSRNNLSYVWDITNKRRDDLAEAALRGDEAAVEQQLMQLYALPFLYDDVLSEPLGGFVSESLLETYSSFDPDGKYWEVFQLKLKEYMENGSPEIRLEISN